MNTKNYPMTSERPLEEPQDFSVSLDKELGQVAISNDVVARVAALAASQVGGISLGKKFSMSDLLGRKEPVRGITIEVEGTQAVISLEVKVEYGRNMYDMAQRLQRKVKDAVEQMTGLAVNKVNVAIIDILDESERRDRTE